MNKFTCSVLYLTVCCSILCCAPIAKSASNDMSILLRVHKCNVTVVPVADKGCNDTKVLQQQLCKNEHACVCLAKGAHISWLLDSTQDTFKIKFVNGSPLSANCGKNFKKSEHRCVIKADVKKDEVYEYGIILRSCAKGTDPKIIIK